MEENKINRRLSDGLRNEISKQDDEVSIKLINSNSNLDPRIKKENKLDFCRQVKNRNNLDYF